MLEACDFQAPFTVIAKNVQVASVAVDKLTEWSLCTRDVEIPVLIMKHKRIVLLDTSTNTFYDADIGVCCSCNLLSLEEEKLVRKNEGVDVFFIRLDYLAKIHNKVGGVLLPAALKVDGHQVQVHYDHRYHDCCYAFPSLGGFEVQCAAFQAIYVDGRRVRSSSVLLLPKEAGTKMGYNAIELPGTLDLCVAGKQLWVTPAEEVYKGHRLQPVTRRTSISSALTFRGCEPVLIKTVRLPQGTSTQPHTMPSPFFNTDDVPALIAIEATMRILNAVQEEQPHLRHHFMECLGVGRTEDLLYVITPYARFGTLSHYLTHSPGPCKKLSEFAAQHVVWHLLQSLACVHEKSNSIGSITLDTVVLQTCGDRALRDRYHEFLCDADFKRLTVTLVDFSQVRVHDLQSPHAPPSPDSVASVPAASGPPAEMLSSESAPPCGCHSPASMPRALHVRSLSPLGETHASIKPAYQSPQTSVAVHLLRNNPITPSPPKEYNGMREDMWQLGVVLFALLVGGLPFEVRGQEEVQWFQDIKDGRLGEHRVLVRGVNGWARRPLSECVSADALDLLQHLLCFDAENRISASAALQHAWVRRG